LLNGPDLGEFFDSCQLYHYYCAPMLTTPLPVYVDARRAFSQEQALSGHISLQNLPRTADCVIDREGQVQVELRFFIDGAGRRRISGCLKAPLTLTCQRCLEPNAIELDEIFDLVLVPDEESAGQLDKEFDPWICADFRIVLADLIDEQILLGMPIVSFHQSGPCCEQSQDADQVGKAVDEGDSGPAAGPFAVLADLKSQRNTT